MCAGPAIAVDVGELHTHTLSHRNLSLGREREEKKNFIESNTLKFFLRGNLFFDHITLDIISKSMFIGRIDSWI